MLDINMLKLEKVLLNVEEAVREVIISGPKDSTFINTVNSTLIADVTAAVIDNEELLGVDLNKELIMNMDKIDTAFLELKLENKKEEQKMLNFKYLKNGEVQSIINNLKAGKISNNCICLNNTDTILLRTNGSVIYGEYKEGNARVKFTHSPQYALPYIAKQDYAKYKDVVLAEWSKAYTDEARGKMREVRALIAHIMKNKDAEVTVDTTETVENITPVVATEPVAQEPIINNTKKVEVKDMNKELNVMGLAHKIRKELALEGDYSAQMKMALSYAWAIKKGTATIESILGTTESAAHTYNADNKTVEPSVVETPKEEKQTSSATVGLTIYLDKLEDGYAYFNKQVNGKSGLFLKYKARNTVDMDKQFARDWLVKILNGAPNNTVIYFYGDYTEMTYLNSMSLRDLAKSKNIKVTRGLYGVAPSGEAV